MYNSNPEPMTTITIRLPVWLKDKLLQAAKDKRCSASVIARAAFERLLVIDKQGGDE